MEENRVEEAKLRKADSERMQKELETMQKQHREQLEEVKKAARDSEETRRMWRDAGHLVGGILTQFTPLGKLTGMARLGI